MWVPCLYGGLSKALLPFFLPNKPQFCSASHPSPMWLWGRQSITLPAPRVDLAYSKSGCLRAIDISSQLVLYCGGPAILRRSSAASLTSLYSLGARNTPTPVVITKGVFRHCQASPGRKSALILPPWLRTTGLECLKGVKLSPLKLLFLSFFVTGDDKLPYPSRIRYFCYL